MHHSQSTLGWLVTLVLDWSDQHPVQFALASTLFLASVIVGLFRSEPQ